MPNASASVKSCARCAHPATHGVYYQPKAQRWEIALRHPTRAPKMWCRWHATVQAVLRNAGSPLAEGDGV
jgi:hypothetical protein